MQLCFIAHNQEQHKFDFPMSLYQTLTIILPSKQIIIDFQTGQIHSQALENQPRIATEAIVSKFQKYQEKQGLGDSTIAS
jgi:hypothetical protein